MKIEIVRNSINSKSITGELYVDGKYICKTLEKPDNNNAKDNSAIPEGNYGGILRYDHHDKWRIEFTGTGPRTHVQIHIGNTPDDTKGCVLVGEEVDTANNRLAKSAAAYLKLKKAFYGSENPTSTPNNEITVQIKSSYGPNLAPAAVPKPKH